MNIEFFEDAPHSDYQVYVADGPEWGDADGRVVLAREGEWVATLDLDPDELGSIHPDTLVDLLPMRSVADAWRAACDAPYWHVEVFA